MQTSWPACKKFWGGVETSTPVSETCRGGKEKRTGGQQVRSLHWIWTFQKIVFSFVISSLLGRGQEIIGLDVNFFKNSFLICDLLQGEGKKGCRSKTSWGRSLFSDLLLDQHGSARYSIGLNPSQKLAVVTYFIKLIFILHRLAPRVAIKENARSLVARFVICQLINLKFHCSPFIKGLPPPVRGKVWRLALNNSLNLTTQLYSILRSA